VFVPEVSQKKLTGSKLAPPPLTVRLTVENIAAVVLGLKIHSIH